MAASGGKAARSSEVETPSSFDITFCIACPQSGYLQGADSPAPIKGATLFLFHTLTKFEKTFVCSLCSRMFLMFSCWPVIL